MENLVTVQTGAEAWEKLADKGFLWQWKQIYDACPWATPFQSSAFICVWFENYRSRYSPVIISLPKNDHQLYGLLILAMSVDRKQLVVAGDRQAEYQVWLATRDSHQNFVAEMATALDVSFPGYHLVFKYIPDATPVSDLMGLPTIRDRAELKTHQRPIIRIDKKDLDDSFRKKSNKSRFNRLKKLGELEFKQVTDEKTFSEVIDTIIDFYDFRQGATNSAFPFLRDPFKKPFHLDLMKQHADILHVTLTTLNESPIAAHIGVVGRRQVHLAILAYSPFCAEHSPGKLHLMMLGRCFADQEIGELDLTPGGDAWKERFANCHDEVYELILHNSGKARALSAFQTRALHLIKDRVKGVGLTPERVRRYAKTIKHMQLKKLASTFHRLLFEFVEFRIYQRTLRSSDFAPSGGQMKINQLSDLIKFEPSESWQTKEMFMAESLQRLERGEQVYTYASNERLFHFGWLVGQQHEAYFTEVQQRFQYPEGTAVLYDFYTNPDARGQGLYQKTLSQMLSDVSKLDGVRQVYISVRADNKPSRHVIEKLGFEYQSSLFHLRVLGISKKWRVDTLFPSK